MLLALAIAACYAAYAPGLDSGFLFDDAANLPVLGDFGRIDNLAALLRYLTAGRADPTGRPVAQLSFLVDARNWPADPIPFKRTNLLLHLANGVLLAVFLRRYGTIQGLDGRASRFASIFAASAWVLHPLFVSTVLYVVQREAILCATFVLLGLHVWLGARAQLLARGGTAWPAALGVLGCTLLATLSKANGALLPLLILVVEASLPEKHKTGKVLVYRRWLRVVAWPGAGLVLLGVVVVAMRSIGHGIVPGRSFSTLQRLMTEPRVLVDYLKLLWLVDPHYGSLFHDQYRPAINWKTPWQTVPCIAFCLALATAAWKLRHRYHAFAIAILFFFAGHVMESTSLSLELYFEHRNYLPAMLLFWPVGVGMAACRLRRVATAGSILLLSGLAALTYATASLWGRPLEQSLVWAAEAPKSPRAQAYAAQMEAEYGYVESALHRLEQAKTVFPSELQIALPIIDLRCQLHIVSESDWAAAERALRTTPREPGRLLMQWMTKAMEQAAESSCPGLDDGKVLRLLDAAASNPRISAVPGRMQDIAHLRGLVALRGGDVEKALAWFNAALKLDPKPAVALGQAAVLGGSGHPREGLSHLDFFDTLEVTPMKPDQGMPWVHDWILTKQNYWPTEIQRVRSILQHDARSSGE